MVSIRQSVYIYVRKAKQCYSAKTTRHNVEWGLVGHSEVSYRPIIILFASIKNFWEIGARSTSTVQLVGNSFIFVNSDEEEGIEWKISRNLRRKVTLFFSVRKVYAYKITEARSFSSLC